MHRGNSRFIAEKMRRGMNEKIFRKMFGREEGNVKLNELGYDALKVVSDLPERAYGADWRMPAQIGRAV